MGKEYVIGIDLGINNVGWSILNPNNNTIEKTGVKLFKSSDGAQNRREFRSGRRRYKRKNNRKKDILKIFSKIGFPNVNTVDSNLLEKRILGLNNQIEKQDIVNICCYYASHRGYIPFGDEDRELVKLNGLYPCEYYKNLLVNEGKYRAMEEVIDNNDLMKEFTAILDKQSIFYNELSDIKETLHEIITRKRKFWEGPGSENSRTDYGRFKTQEYKDSNNVKEDLKFLYDDLIGKCAICIHEKTVPISNYYYEEFNLLNDFINTSIVSIDNLIDQNAVEQDKTTGYYKLTTESLEKVIDYCKTNIKLSYDKIYKNLFGLNKEDLSGYRVDKDHRPLFSTMNIYRSIKKAFENLPNTWIGDIQQYNEVIRILAISPGIIETKKLIEESEVITYNFSEEEYQILKNVSIKLKGKMGFNYGSLSEKALKRAINDMLSTCKNFMQVRRNFDYDKEAREYYINKYTETEGMLLMDSKFVNDIIASPQVKKSLRQAIKLINSIILEKEEYPEIIAVESTHQMNSKEMSKKIEKEQKEEENARKKASTYILNTFGDSYLTEKNITKVMLYNELDGRCPYCNEPFKDGENAIIKGSLEIEHILPLSKSYDDSYSNKTLSCRKCNAEKENKTPYLWMGKEKFLEFSERIKKYSISDNKRENFLETRDLDKYNTRFFHKNLTDTAYATRELINQINIFNEFLNYKLKNNKRIKTLSTPGKLTSNIRKALNLEKDRDAGKFHHAVDASIVGGIALDKGIGKILIESQNDKQFWMKKKYTDKEIGNLILKYKRSVLDKELRKINSDEDIFLSDQVTKDPNRSIANANIYKYLKLNGEYKKVEQISNIYDEKLMKNKILSKLFDDGDNNYNLMIKDNNPKMYKKLQKIYNEYQKKGESENPFINYCLEINDIKHNEFYYRMHGIKEENGPIIKKLRYYSNTTNPILLEKKNMFMKKNTFIGLDDVSQICTKVYWDNDKEKFIFLPIYVTSIDFNTKKINKKEQTYKMFYDKYLNGKNYTFVADLYNGNLIRIEKKNGSIVKGFVGSFHKTNNFILLKNNEGFRPSDKSLTIIDTDYLGNEKIRLTWPSR